MKLVVWLVLLFAAAVVAALTLGANDGLASFTGPAGASISLNLFLLLLIAGCFALVTAIQAIESLTCCPSAPGSGAWPSVTAHGISGPARGADQYFGALQPRPEKPTQRAQHQARHAEGLQRDPAFESLVYLLSPPAAPTACGTARVRDEAWQRAWSAAAGRDR